MEHSTDELEEFRRQWREEVKIKKHVEQPQVDSATVAIHLQSNEESAQHGRSSPPGLGEHVTEPESTLADIEEANVEKGSAMDYYVLAVDKERQGNLGKGNSCPP